jgi:molybdopterin-guanine dinucleotide biosynthesis protein B
MPDRRTAADRSAQGWLLTTPEVAGLLRVHPKHVYRLIRRGMPSLRVGGEHRFERLGVLDWARSPANRVPHSARTRHPQVFKIVGPSGVGKTTLAERLIHDWTKAGLRVGFLKHAAHGFDLDRRGKDSERASRAGAQGVALLGPGQVAFLESGPEAEAESLVARLFGGYDMVVVEGFSGSKLPCVVFQESPTRKFAPVGDVVVIVECGKRVRSATSPPRVPRTAVARIRGLLERRLGL